MRRLRDVKISARSRSDIAPSTDDSDNVTCICSDLHAFPLSFFGIKVITMSYYISSIHIYKLHMTLNIAMVVFLLFQMAVVVISLQCRDHFPHQGILAIIPQIQNVNIQLKCHLGTQSF